MEVAGREGRVKMVKKRVERGRVEVDGRKSENNERK